MNISKKLKKFFFKKIKNSARKLVKGSKYLSFLFQLEAWFEERLRCVRGLVIKPVRGDGACLFRAVGECRILRFSHMHTLFSLISRSKLKTNSEVINYARP